MPLLQRSRIALVALVLLTGVAGAVATSVPGAPAAHADNVAPVDTKYDSAGNRYEAGWLYGTVSFGPGPGQTISGNNALYVASWTPANTLRWVHSITAPLSTSYGGLMVTAGGRAVLVGSGYPPIKISTIYGPRSLSGYGNTDMFLAAFEGADGHIALARTEGGPGAETVFGATSDGFNNLYVVGSFAKTATFGTSPTTTNLTSDGLTDGLVASYTSGGTLRWAVANSHGTNLSDTRAVLLSSGALYVGGTWTGKTTLGSSTVYGTDTGNQCVYLERLDPSNGAAQWVRLARGVAPAPGHVVVDRLSTSAGKVQLRGAATSPVGFSAPGGSVVATFSAGPATTAFFATYATNGYFQGVVAG